MKEQLDHLLNKINRVTAYHRHGQKVSAKDLDALSNAQIQFEEVYKQVSVEPVVKVQIAEMVERHLIAHEQMKEQYLDKNLEMYSKAGAAILALEKLLKDLRKSNLSA